MEYLGGQGFVSKSKIYSVLLDKFNVLNIKVYVYMFILIFMIIIIGLTGYLNSLKSKAPY